MNMIITIVGLLLAQPSPIESLIDAERSFAKLSVEVNIRHAFVSNMDDNSIVFQQGEPLNGLQTWSAYEATNDYLFWWPEYADIAASGDFGYTTGPAEWGGARQDRKATGGGYYSTVWKKNSNGEWKIAIDMGSAKYIPGTPKKDVKTPTASTNLTMKADIDKEKSILASYDQLYLDALHQNKTSILPSYFHTESRIHHGGREPVTDANEIKNFKEEGEFTFEQKGADISSSADLGFTYGKVKLNRIKEGNVQTLNLNYLRIWKKVNNQWKIVLDVIGG